MKHCFVTGAAQGIGRAIAERFAREGYAVLGVDRDAERAEAAAAELRAAGHEASFLVQDLTARDATDEVLRFLRAQVGPAGVDVLVCNAGINAVGPFGKQDLAALRSVFELNLVSPLLLTNAILAAKLLAPKATVVCVASLSYYLGYPGAAVYAATKDGLTSYAGSLAAFGRTTGVRVLTVFPGPTRTEHARRHSPPGAREDRRMPPEELAERILRAVVTERRQLIPGLGNRLAAVLGRLLPRLGERMMRRVIYDRLPGAKEDEDDRVGGAPRSPCV